MGFCVTGRWPVNSPHKGPVTREMFPFDDIIMSQNAGVLVALLLSVITLNFFNHSFSFWAEIITALFFYLLIN